MSRSTAWLWRQGSQQSSRGKPVTEGDLVGRGAGLLGTLLVAICAPGQQGAAQIRHGSHGSSHVLKAEERQQLCCACPSLTACPPACPSLTACPPEPGHSRWAEALHCMALQPLQQACAQGASDASAVCSNCTVGHLVAGSFLHQSLNTQVGHLRAQNAARAPLGRQTEGVGSCTCRAWHSHCAEAALMRFMAVLAVHFASNPTKRPVVTVQKQPSQNHGCPGYVSCIEPQNTAHCCNTWPCRCISMWATAHAWQGASSVQKQPRRA